MKMIENDIKKVDEKIILFEEEKKIYQDSYNSYENELNKARKIVSEIKTKKGIE